jgi:hypothetical protein
MRLPPEVWGPVFWGTLHIVALAFPDEPSYAEKRAAKEFYRSMVFLLPCPVCRTHFAGVLEQEPVENWLDNRKSLIEWNVKAHNRVNAQLGKPEITVEDFYKRYQEMADRGLPIPPANPTAEIADAAMQDVYLRAVFHTTGFFVAAGAIGALLWYSYKKS